MATQGRGGGKVYVYMYNIDLVGHYLLGLYWPVQFSRFARSAQLISETVYFS